MSQSSRHFPASPVPGHLHQKDKTEKKDGKSGYQQPTVSSRTRALSPYTHRKMCQLSEDARQRLSHLQLGPHYFTKETESHPPFLVSTAALIALINHNNKTLEAYTKATILSRKNTLILKHHYSFCCDFKKSSNLLLKLGTCFNSLLSRFLYCQQFTASL